MALRRLVSRNYGGKSPVSIYRNLYSFKRGGDSLKCPWNEKNITLTWFSSLYSPFKSFWENVAKLRACFLKKTKFEVMFRFISAILGSNISRYSPVQSQQWKHQINVWNIMFKVNNKNTRTTSVMSFWCLSC